MKFCHSKNLVLLADEVYQENVWDPKSEFISFKKTANRMGLKLELASFHSVSKVRLSSFSAVFFIGVRTGFLTRRWFVCWI